MKYLFAACIICVIVFMYGGIGILTNQYDDSYITYRYAVNLANGDGMVFNAGEHVDAASSFLYVVILAASYKMGISSEIASIIISLLSLGIICVLIINTSQSWIGYVIAALVCLHGFMSGWAVSGMETVFFAMLVSLFVYCVLNKSDSKILAVLIVSIVLARHDGLLLLPVYLWIERKNWKHIAIVLSITGIYYLARYLYYGDIIPHVMQVKNGNPYYHGNPNEMLQHWLSYCSAVMFGWAAIFKKNTICLYCLIAYLVYSFGIRADLVRYSVHLLPVMVIIFLYFAVKQHNKQLIYAFMVILALNTYMSVGKYRAFMLDYRPTQEARQTIGEIVREQIPESERIISGDIGIIAYTAINHQFIDMVGLTSQPAYPTHKYIADTINSRDYSYPRLPGKHNVLAVYGQQGKPYAIGLLERVR